MKAHIGAAIAGLAGLAGLALVGCARPDALEVAADPGLPTGEVAVAAERASPLSVADLNALYHNRTWVWDDGAGYFDGSKRTFAAWSGSRREATFGEGTWFLGDPGRMCFRAAWHALGGRKTETTCFDHRRDANRTYQRRVGDGSWYVFAHSPPRAGDEIRKLRSGDHVAPNLERNRRAIAQGKGK